MNIAHVNWNGQTTSENRNRKLRLVFLGYSFTPDCISHLEIGNADLSVVNNYRNLDFDKTFLEGRDIELISWSMGVWASNRVLNNVNITKAVAINGTPFGIHEKYGIPKGVFLRTIRRFDFTSFKKWCFGDFLDKANFSFDENPKEELEAIYKACTEDAYAAQDDNEEGIASNIRFDKAIISTKDLVFPPQASLMFENRQEIDAPHYPFFNFKSLDEILEV